MAAGQFIPYAGQLIGVLSRAASTSNAAEKEKAKRAFASRLLNGIELAPEGRVHGSAFLPNIPQARTLVVKYTQVGATDYLEIPLPSSGP